MGFKFANQSTETLPLKQDQSVEVRSEVDKDTFKRLVGYMPQREMDEASSLTPEEGVTFQEGLFNSLVVAWSAPLPATLENYRKLDPMDEVTQSLDEALAAHFAKLSPSDAESKAPKTSRDAKPKA